MQKTRKNWNYILWNLWGGFSAMIVLTWLAELLRIPHYVFGEPFEPNWHRAMLRTLVVLLTWAWVHWSIKRLLKRLYYLEEFLQVCAWCRRVSHDGQWMNMETYFKSNFATRTSHGICPECYQAGIAEMEEATPEQHQS